MNDQNTIVIFTCISHKFVIWCVIMLCIHYVSFDCVALLIFAGAYTHTRTHALVRTNCVCTEENEPLDVREKERLSTMLSIRIMYIDPNGFVVSIVWPFVTDSFTYFFSFILLCVYVFFYRDVCSFPIFCEKMIAAVLYCMCNSKFFCFMLLTVMCLLSNSLYSTCYWSVTMSNVCWNRRFYSNIQIGFFFFKCKLPERHMCVSYFLPLSISLSLSLCTLNLYDKKVEKAKECALVSNTVVNNLL